MEWGSEEVAAGVSGAGNGGGGAGEGLGSLCHEGRVLRTCREFHGGCERNKSICPGFHLLSRGGLWEEGYLPRGQS